METNKGKTTPPTKTKKLPPIRTKPPSKNKSKNKKATKLKRPPAIPTPKQINNAITDTVNLHDISPRFGSMRKLLKSLMQDGKKKVATHIAALMWKHDVTVSAFIFAGLHAIDIDTYWHLNED